MVIKTQDPDWNDLQVLIDTILDSTEKEMVLKVMVERAKERIRTLPRAARGTVNDFVPREDPDWDANNPADYKKLKIYQELLVEGIRCGIPKTLNWSKLYSVMQDKTESPSAFLERLKETARRYTDLDVEDESGKLQLALIFMGQSQEYIRKKFQKLEGRETRDLEKLLEVAWKAYNNREKESTKKQQASLLALLQASGENNGAGGHRGRSRGNRGRGGMGRGFNNQSGFGNQYGGGRGRIGPNQCALCKGQGHWKNECPLNAGNGMNPWNPQSFVNPQNPVGMGTPQGVAQAFMLGSCGRQSRLDSDLKVVLEVEGEPTEFRIDTGASFSAMNKLMGPLSDSTVQVVGVSGQIEERTFLRPLDIKFKGRELDHQFLYMPNSPECLLGRDLLSALQAKIIFEKGRVKIEIPEENLAKIFVVKEVEKEEIPQEIEQAVVPWVWETGVPGKSKAATPVRIELKEGAQPVRVRQYPISLEARKGIAPMISQFLTLGILQECESEFNTPIFPIKKPNGKYRLVQDLRAVNLITKDIHPVVANPYTLLTSVSEKFQWFTVVDLKDAFFCIPLARESWKIFAFEWESPETGRKRQLAWTRLPQGFKCSPTIFGNQLAKELEEWKTTQVKESPFSYIILQYVDDIFLGATEQGLCRQLTIELLNMLGQAGYRVSKEKAQLVKRKVIYLGCEISQGVRRLGTNRIQAICAIPVPRNNQELRSFLGMVGWCRLWIPNFGLTARPLYEAAKESKLTWGTEQEKAFQELKKALQEAPALGLPDPTKEFQLYVCERQRMALGVLTQRLGSWKRPVGYFSKRLDAVSGGWPGCLRAVAATVILIQEARKLTLGKHMIVYVPHMVIAVLEQKGGHWLSSSRMLQYQALLREQDDVELKITNHLNPAEFLRSTQEEGTLEHDCVETIEQVYASRRDLKDEPLTDPDWELYTDGSSFVENGTRGQRLNIGKKFYNC
ncbi:uncharacterized protein LOC127462542 [Manacus candei]|uniref:uncharacterized protein LOC127462542 n=1 Tax=Manacus candei TaxID=415023 RepID=UPI0022266AFA|nr:uncharacterized protein LOC127462542 [Manacus candei]